MPQPVTGASAVGCVGHRSVQLRYPADLPPGNATCHAPAGRFILHVVGCASSDAGMVFTVFQP